MCSVSVGAMARVGGLGCGLGGQSEREQTLQGESHRGDRTAEESSREEQGVGECCWGGGTPHRPVRRELRGKASCPQMAFLPAAPDTAPDTAPRLELEALSLKT